MLLDYEHELTTAGGQVITGDAYGTKSYDQKGAGDAAIGEPLQVFFQVLTDFVLLTSLKIAIRGDDDGAGTNVTGDLLPKTVLLADLTAAKGVQRVGVLPPGTSKRHLRVHFDVTGTDPNSGSKIKVWFVKGTDASPANPAFTI